MRSLFTSLFTALALSVLSVTGAFAETKSAFSDAQRAEIISLVRQYIVDNPQALIASVESHYNKQQEDAKQQEGKLEEVPTGLYDSPFTPAVGPKDAKFTVRRDCCRCERSRISTGAGASAPQKSNHFPVPFDPSPLHEKTPGLRAPRRLRHCRLRVRPRETEADRGYRAAPIAGGQGWIRR